VTELAALNDQPPEQRKRVVMIRQKCQSAMQSGTGKIHAWTITWANEGAWV
jgi:hypothetical protein